MAAAEPGGDLHHDRPVRAEAELRVGRAVADPDRLDRRAGDARRPRRVVRATATTWASATPNAGGSAVSRSVTVQRDEAAVDRDGVDGHLRPFDVLLDEHRAAAGLARARSRAPRRARRASARAQPALALPVGRLDDDGERELRAPRVELAARAARRPRRTPPAGAPSTSRSTAVRRGDRMRQADPLGDPRGDPDRPVGARRDDAVDLARPREPVDRLLVLGRDDRALVGEREARRPAGRGRPRSRARRPSPRAASSSPSCAGPAPRTRRRRRARERPATRPRSRGTRRRCARALPRTRSRPASP